MNRVNARTGSGSGFNGAAILDSLVSGINRRIGDTKSVPSFFDWAAGIVLDGKALDFVKHRYLEELYRDPFPHTTVIKATQLGITSQAALYTIYSALYRGLRNQLYYFPTEQAVGSFVRSRFNPLMIENEEMIGRYVQDTDSTQIKRLGPGFVHFRGGGSRISSKSTPGDRATWDELDEWKDMMIVAMGLERLAHSEFREVMFLSNPTIPDYAIDAEYQKTDRRAWLIKCSHCNRWVDMVASFPKCLREMDDGRVIRCCDGCAGEIYPADGQWVPAYPNIKDRRGYRISQLYSEFVNPAEILRAWQSSSDLQSLFNLKIGVAWVEAQNRLGIQEVLSLCGNDGIAVEDKGPATMGVDQGKDLHVVIGKRHGTKAGQIIHLGVYKDFEELDNLMEKFHVSRCVIDALPETRLARAFAERHRGRIFLSFYSSGQKGGASWNERDLTVSVNRTEALDSSHNELMMGKIILPRVSDLTRTFAEHCHATAKKLEEDPETGSKKYIYLKLGPDHFRHAFNYESMARQYGAESVFGQADLT